MVVRQPSKPPKSLAERCSYWLEPKNWLVITVVGIGGHVDGLAGVGWGLLAALFTAVLPTLFVDYGIRRGRWNDRNVGARGPRLVVLAFIMASVTAGLIALIVLHAPGLLTESEAQAAQALFKIGFGNTLASGYDPIPPPGQMNQTTIGRGAYGPVPAGKLIHYPRVEAGDC